MQSRVQQFTNIVPRPSHLVIWSEESMQTDNEPQFLSRARQLSTQYGAHLAVAYKLTGAAPNDQAQNKMALVVPSSTRENRSGEAFIAFTYQKAHPVPMAETDTQPGPQWRLPYYDTDFGRVGGSICFDYDFPTLA